MQEVTDVQAYVYLGQIAERLQTQTDYTGTILFGGAIGICILLAILFIRKWVIALFSSWGGKFRL